MIGKPRQDPLFVEFEYATDGVVTQTAGDKLLLIIEKLGITLTLDAQDCLSKIEVIASSSQAQDFLKSFNKDLQPPINEEKIIEYFGKPTVILTHPHSSDQDKQYLYNQGHYWLSMKWLKNALVSVSMLNPDLIPSNIRTNTFPIRTCKSKE